MKPTKAHRHIDVALPGNVIIAAADSFEATAVSGDLMLGLANNKDARRL